MSGIRIPTVILFSFQVCPSPATGSKLMHTKEFNIFMTDAMSVQLKRKIVSKEQTTYLIKRKRDKTVDENFSDNKKYLLFVAYNQCCQIWRFVANLATFHVKLKFSKILLLFLQLFGHTVCWIMQKNTKIKLMFGKTPFGNSVLKKIRKKGI